MAKFTKTGKPVCWSRRNGRKCQRLGVWSFTYRSMGQSVKAYYCEACAADHDYEAFHQSLVREG